jgi:hypothetical protein
MRLKKAVELQMTHYNHSGMVRVDENEYFCLNDLNSFYPNKRVDNWMRLDSTQEFISLVERNLNTSNVSELKKAIIAKRGKYGGTYAHKLIAMEFCMWLSPEFKLQVITEYESGTTQKENWNFKRILAAESVKIQSEAVKEILVPTVKPEHERFQYTNNVRMINSIVGVDSVDDANEEQLEQIGYLERKNAFYLEEGIMDHQERKTRLKDAFSKKYGIKMISSGMVA